MIQLNPFYFSGGASSFAAYINVTYPTGATVILNGQTATGSPYIYTVNAAGTYTVLMSLNGKTESHSVVITTDGQTELLDLSFDKTTFTGIQRILDFHEEANLLSAGDQIYTEIDGVTTLFLIGSVNLYSDHEVLFTSNTNNMNRAYNTSQSNAGGWSASALRTYLNNTYKDLLPDEIKNNLKTFEMKSGAGNSNSVNTSYDDIFLPREKEVFGTITYGATGEGAFCEQWDLFKTVNGRQKDFYWKTASAFRSDTYDYVYVSSSGTVAGVDALAAWGTAISFMFKAN